MKNIQTSIWLVMGMLGVCPGFSYAQSLVETVEIPAGTFYMAVSVKGRISTRHRYIGLLFHRPSGWERQK